MNVFTYLNLRKLAGAGALTALVMTLSGGVPVRAAEEGPPDAPKEAAEAERAWPGRGPGWRPGGPRWQRDDNAPGPQGAPRFGRRGGGRWFGPQAQPEPKKKKADAPPRSKQAQTGPQAPSPRGVQRRGPRAQAFQPGAGARGRYAAPFGGPFARSRSRAQAAPPRAQARCPCCGRPGGPLAGAPLRGSWRGPQAGPAPRGGRGFGAAQARTKAFRRGRGGGPGWKAQAPGQGRGGWAFQRGGRGQGFGPRAQAPQRGRGRMGLRGSDPRGGPGRGRRGGGGSWSGQRGPWWR
jgi:translation initiation factor IF-2